MYFTQNNTVTYNSVGDLLLSGTIRYAAVQVLNTPQTHSGAPRLFRGIFATMFYGRVARSHTIPSLLGKAAGGLWAVLKYPITLSTGVKKLTIPTGGFMAATTECAKLYARELLKAYLHHATDAEIQQTIHSLERIIRRTIRTRKCIGLNDAAYHIYVRYRLPLSAGEKGHE